MGNEAQFHWDNVITNLGRSSDAFEGSPAPSTIQGDSDDSSFWTVFAPEIIISFNLVCKESKDKIQKRIIEGSEPSTMMLPIFENAKIKKQTSLFILIQVTEKKKSISRSVI